MSPEFWHRLKPLYEAALKRPVEERAQFIEEACLNDGELKRELEALLHESLHKAVEIRDKGGGAEGDTAHRVLADGELIEGRFRIVRHIGSGGMGEVYEAIDLQLGRVALKTIRQGVTQTQDQLSRFINEVQLARKVISPHVCRIHDLHLVQAAEESPMRAFLTMEFLEGITLRDRICENGPLPWGEAKAVALEICEGLKSIHECGVVHRDIKGRNIMLTHRNGQPCTVVMDFGIAHKRSAGTGDTSTALTRAGAVIGTPDYMAPEQFEGKDVTPATDVYALGIVLHEMVTGKRPSSQTLPPGWIGQRVKPSVSASTLQPGLPRPWDGVIAKCLEYDPTRRYQSAHEVAAAIRGQSLLSRFRQRPLIPVAFLSACLLVAVGLMLIPAIGERVRGMLFSSKEKHIAVLPFDVLGATPETQALGDGLMDSLSGRLSNLDVANQSLWVVPASEVRNRHVHDAASALREFGATIVVRGSFERSNQVARLRLTLIDSRKTREIGYVELETLTGDLSTLQDKAVASLGRLMNVSLGTAAAGSERAVSGPVPRAAYEDYLTGIGYFARFDQPGNIDRAIQALKNSVTTDPHFSLGLARLAQVYIMKYRIESNPEWLQRAEEYGRRAAELNDNVPSTYVALASVHERTGRHELAAQEYQHALDLDPREAEAVAGLAHSFASAGRASEAEAEYIKAASLRPQDWTGYNALGNFYENHGRHEEAIAQYLHALQLTPDNSGVYENLGVAYSNSDAPGMVEKAEAALERSIAISPSYIAYGDLAFLYTAEHRFAESVKASKTALKLNDQSYDLWANLAEAYEWMHDEDSAVAARKKAIELLEGQVRLNPQDAEAQATLAALYAKMGDREKSLSGIHISLALSPGNRYVLCQVADAYELMGNRKSALSYLHQAISHGLSQLQVKEDSALQPVVADPRFRSRPN